jgi:hypothetical protein
MVLLAVSDLAKVPAVEIGFKSKEILLAIVTLRNGSVTKVGLPNINKLDIRLTVINNRIDEQNKRGRSTNGRSEKPLALKHRLLLLLFAPVLLFCEIIFTAHLSILWCSAYLLQKWHRIGCNDIAFTSVETKKH